METSNGVQSSDDYGLGDPWGISTQPFVSQAAAARGAGEQRAVQPQQDDWDGKGAPSIRRSKSLTQAEAHSLPAGPTATADSSAADAPSRSNWRKPFSRRRKKDKGSGGEEDSSREPSLSGHAISQGASTVLTSQFQRAASLVLPGERQHHMAFADRLAAAGRSPDGQRPIQADAAPQGATSRRFWSKGDAAPERPASAVPSRAAEPEAAERSSKSVTESSSRWNPFSRGGPKTPPLTQPLMASDGVSSSLVDASDSSSASTSKRSSLEGETASRAALANGHGSVPASPFAQGALSGAESNGEERRPGEEGKKGHRRGRSFSAMLMPLKTKGRRASLADELDSKGDLDERSGRSVGEVLQRPKTPEAAKRAASGALACFGMTPKLDDDTAAPVRNISADSQQNNPVLPPSLVGLKNLGNTCFVNAAMQCLRHTPGLPLLLLPDLLTAAPPSESSATSEPATPTAAAVLGPREGSNRSEPEGEVTAGASPQGSSPRSAIIGTLMHNGSPVETIAPPPAEPLPVMPENEPPPEITSPTTSASEPRSNVATTALPAAGAQSAAGQPQEQQSAPVVGSNGTAHNAVSDGMGPLSAEAAAEATVAAKAPASAVPSDNETPSDVVDRPSSPLARIRITSPLPVQPSDPADGGKTAAANPAVQPSSVDGSSPLNPSPQPAGASGSATLPEQRAEPTDGAQQAADGLQQQAAPASAVHASDQQTAGEESPAQQLPAAPPKPPVKPPPPPLEKGELLDAFKQLVRQLYSKKKGSVDPGFLVRRLGALGAALGEDFIDGGQHDCEEALSAIIDQLHLDLNRVEAPPEPESKAGLEGAQRQASCGSISEPGDPATPLTPSRMAFHHDHRLMMAGSLARESVALESSGYRLRTLSPALSGRTDSGSTLDADPSVRSEAGAPAGAQQEAELAEDPNETELEKADRIWKLHLERNDSPVTDLFGGQLQGNVTCHSCQQRFTRYEFFKGLSLPLVRETGRGGLSSWFSPRPPPSSITDCLAAFTADETLEGNETEYYACDKCKKRTAATINMRIHRFPSVLMLHIMRFRVNGTIREKLTANVAFPLKGLKLGPYASDESGFGDAGGPEYDLYAVVNHSGTMAGGHYTASCRTPGTKDQWHTYNDEVVVKTAASAVATAQAYILFYVRRDSG